MVKNPGKCRSTKAAGDWNEDNEGINAPPYSTCMQSISFRSTVLTEIALEVSLNNMRYINSRFTYLLTYLAFDERKRYL